MTFLFSIRPVHAAYSTSSKGWMMRQAKDPYVKAAKANMYRARSAFKLSQIDQKYRVIPHGGVVVDCGAAPGGWTQVAVAKAQKKGLVVAVDLLPMDPVSGAHCIKGDFMSLKVQNKVKALLGRRKADLVCSDMAPSFMGNHMADHARSMELCESALTFAQTVLATNGCFVAKVIN
ncbi:ribosomal RNA large subunit methyltransferase J, partial [Phycomyces blakesleeanus]